MILISILFYIYIICIFSFVIGFDRIKEYKKTTTSLKTAFSVIIPFRNEAKNLPKLLQSISELDYPKELVEFIFVDDDSIDDSVNVITSHQEATQLNLDSNQTTISIITNTRVSNSPKKDAITTALKKAKNNWIITTDADCIIPKNWLITIDAFIQQHNCNMIVAPVSYSSNSTFLQQFQSLDFMSLQASTIGGFGIKIPFLSNGANLIYRKDVFEKVNGFEGNDSMASGDDVFLLEKFLQLKKEKVQYLKSKEVIVKTHPVSSFTKLIQQRVRWASKTSNYNLSTGKLIGIIVILGNTIIAIAPGLVLLKMIALKTYVSFYLLKLFFDFLLLERIASFENKKIDFTTYLKSNLVYPYFTILIFIKALFSNYQWKDRTFKM